MQCLARSSPLPSMPCGQRPTPLPSVGALGPVLLVVEDDLDVLCMVSEALTSLGHDVVPVSDGVAAIDRVLCDQSIRYLFTDVAMPYGMNGLQLMKAARAARPGLHVLLTSVHSLEDVLGLGPIPDDVAFIPKPYTAFDVSARLRSGGLRACVPAPGRIGGGRETEAGPRAAPAHQRRLTLRWLARPGHAL